MADDTKIIPGGIRFGPPGTVRTDEIPALVLDWARKGGWLTPDEAKALRAEAEGLAKALEAKANEWDRKDDGMTDPVCFCGGMHHKLAIELRTLVAAWRSRGGGA